MKLKRVIALMLAIAMLPIGQIVFAAGNEAAGGAKAGWFIEAESDHAAEAVFDENAIGGNAVEGEFTVEFTAPEEKSYYLYARALSEDGAGSIAYAFAGDEAQVCNIAPEAGVYTWIKLSGAKTLAEGDNSVTLTSSEDVKIDGIIVSELATLPVDASLDASKAEYAQELELPDVYPDIFDENMANTDIAFEAGDRVLFLGDSITHSVSHTYQYHTWVLTYYATRYPDSEFTYINAGRGGDTTADALKRIVSDINIHDFNKVVVMLGTNDVNRNTWNDRRDDQAACDAMIEKYITNFDILLDNFSDKEIILMGPTCWNEFSAQSAASAKIIEGYNSEMRRVNNYLKDYAYDNSIPYIDLNTALTKAMLYYTRKDSSYIGLYGASDRTHPGELGHYIMGYNFLKAQGGDSLVATTEVDVNAEDVNATNATVENLSASDTLVSYTYKPNSLPMPADTYYRQIQQLIPIDDELNREILKVSGLAEGSYTVKMNGTAVLENVSATDLASGINVADLEANPNQQKALAVKGLINKRSVIEKKNIRDFRQTEYSAITTSTNGLTPTMTYDELIAQASTKSDLASYVTQKKALYNYFGAVDYYEKLIYTVNKPDEVEVTIERTGEADTAVSAIHGYTTEAVALNEGSPEIVFKEKSTISDVSDFTITDGVLTAYSGNAKNVYIPAEVTEIKAGALAAAAEYVYVPANVDSIEEGAFKDLAGADVHFSLSGFLNTDRTFEITDGVAYESDKVLYYNPTDTRTYYEIVFGTTSIADYAFADAVNLGEVFIPDTVTQIGEGAFDNTSLTIKCNEDTAAYNYAVENSLNYEIISYSDNTNITSLSFNGTNVFDFAPEKKEYDITLFTSAADVNVAAEAEEANIGALVEIVNNGAVAPCTITVRVTAQDKKTVGEYVLNFKVKEGISNFTKYDSAGSMYIKQLRLDGKYSIYSGYDATGDNNFILNPENTSNEFGYGLLIQRNKADAYIPTYGMSFYSNNGDPLLGTDGRYWCSFKISEAATVYVGIREGKTWKNGENNGWEIDESGLKIYSCSGTKLYKKHFEAGMVNIPSFGTHESYEADKTKRIESSPSCYAVIFDSSFATEEDKNAEFAVTNASLGATVLSDTLDNAPEVERDAAYDSSFVFEGTAPAGESISMIVTPVDDESTLIAIGETTASDLGIFSFDAPCGEDIAEGVTYKAEITNSKQEKYTYYFKTEGAIHNVTVTVNPEVAKYFMDKNVSDKDFLYASTKLGNKEVYAGSMIVHKSEVIDGVVTPVKENDTYVMESVENHTVGVQFSSERSLHRTGLVGSALKGLNHILANQNTSPGRMKSALSNTTLTWDGESITLDEMYNKYCAFYGGNNVFYTFTPDAAGTAYVALPYENPYYEQMGWKLMKMAGDDIPAGYAEWGVVPESTYFSTKYPYQIAKYQHDETRINITHYSNVYYRSFEADEEVDIYTGGVNYTEKLSELPKTAIRWGEHISIDTDFELIYNNKRAQISSDAELSVEEESVTLSAESTNGATIVLSETEISTFPATVTATVTAAAGNTATYKIIIDQHVAASTKLKSVNYTISGISETFKVSDLNLDEGNEFSVSLPHAEVKAKMTKTITSVTAAVELVDRKASYEMTPADGVLDFSKNGRADAYITVTDSEGNKESYVIHFSIPVYNIQTKGNNATLRKVYGTDQISGYDGYSIGEVGDKATGPINADNFPKDVYVIARNKADAGSITKNMPFYGGATYNSDEAGWWMTFTVTDDSYVYVYDREGWGWPNKDESYWTPATNLESNARYYVHFAQAGETVKIPNYGYSSSWDTDPENPQRLTKDPSFYIVMPVESAKLASVNVTAIAGDVTINAGGKSYDCFGTTTMDFKQGTIVELVAEDDANFMYWTEATTGRIVSYDVSYSFTVGSDRAINAVYRDETDEGVYYVMFKNANGAILAAGYTSANVYAPDSPYLSGYIFDGWYIAGEKTDIEKGDDVKSFGFDEDTIIQAGFKVALQTYSVYLENQSTTEPYGIYGYNDPVSITAPEAEEGKVFAYWMRGSEIVSYSETYNFTMGLSDVSLKAVYLDTAVEAQAVITMEEPVVLSGENRISFMAQRSLPDGYKLAESGILLSQTSGITVDNAKHKAVSASAKANGQFTIRKANVEVGDKWYARAYLIYEYEGQIYTAYSNEVSATYAE